MSSVQDNNCGNCNSVFVCKSVKWSGEPAYHMYQVTTVKVVDICVITNTCTVMFFVCGGHVSHTVSTCLPNIPNIHSCAGVLLKTMRNQFIIAGVIPKLSFSFSRYALKGLKSAQEC